MPDSPSVLVRLSVAVYALLARAMPCEFREEYLSEALLDFRLLLHGTDRLRDGTVFGTALLGLWDLAQRIPRERWGELRRSVAPKRYGAPIRRLGWGGGVMNVLRETRVAVRSLSRRPGFTAVAALTLALGIGSTTAIYSIVDAVLIQPLPYDQSENIVVIRHHAPGIDLPDLELSDGLHNFYTEFADPLASFASYDEERRNLTGGDQAAQIEVVQATPSLFDVLRVVPAMGRPFNAADAAEGAAPVVILTDDQWRARFGADPNVLGRRLEFDGVSTEVVGVMPAGFAFPDEDPAALLPLYVDPNGEFGSFSQRGIARLADGVSLEQAQARLSDLQLRIPDFEEGITPEFLEQTGWSVTVERLRDRIVADVEATLWIVLGTVGFVLLIACANVANLLLVRAESRQKEMAIRAAMGAGRGAVASSFLSESLVLGVIGGAAGVLFAWFGVEMLVAVGPETLPRLHEVGLDGSSIGFAAGVSILASLAFGLIPLTRYAGDRFAVVLRDGGRANTVGKERHRIRNALVASQLALALVLLVGSGLMLRSLAELRAIDPGFEPIGVMTLTLSRGQSEDREGDARFYQMVADEVAALPGVEVVGIASRIPLADGSSNGGSFRIESKPRGEEELPPVAMFRAIGTGYFESMGIEIIAGRDIRRADWEDRAAVMWVNETLANTQFDGNALGERLAFGGEVEFVEIVGVVSNTKEIELTEEDRMDVYLPMLVADWEFPGLRTASLSIKVADGQDLGALVPATRDIIGRLDPNVPLTRSQSLEEVLAESMASTSFTMVLVGIATGVALFLGAIGLFGVISYVVDQRTREIGVRVALGARSDQVSGMVVRQGLVVTTVGVVLGLGGAFGLTRLMSVLLYEVSATDPVTFVLAPVLLVGISLLATWLPARRASRVNPVEALRSE